MYKETQGSDIFKVRDGQIKFEKIFLLAPLEGTFLSSYEDADKNLRVKICVEQAL